MKKPTDGLKSMSFRLPSSYAEKLEKAKWELRMSKVEVVKAALDNLFEQHKIH